MTKDERKKVGKIQEWVGAAKGAYSDDRATCRASRIIPALDEAFRTCVELLSKYPPEQ